MNADIEIGNAASSRNVDETTKDVLEAVAQSAQSLSETTADVESEKDMDLQESEDLSVPKWPKYTDPATQ